MKISLFLLAKCRIFKYFPCLKMNKPVLHPLESMQVEIEKNGWIVLENVNRMPVYNEPYISPHFIIVINHQGISHGEYDFQPIVFRKHDFAVIYPNHTILAKDTSEDYRVTLIVMSGPFFDKMRNRLTYENSSFYCIYAGHHSSVALLI